MTDLRSNVTAIWALCPHGLGGTPATCRQCGPQGCPGQGPGAPCRPLPLGFWVLPCSGSCGESGPRWALVTGPLSALLGPAASSSQPSVPPPAYPPPPHSGPVSSLWSRPLSTRRAPQQKCVWAAPPVCRCPLHSGSLRSWGPAGGLWGWRGTPWFSGWPLCTSTPCPSPPWSEGSPGVLCPQCPLLFPPGRRRADSSREQPAPRRVWGAPSSSGALASPRGVTPSAQGAPPSSLWRRPGHFCNSSPSRSANISSLERPMPRPELPAPDCAAAPWWLSCSHSVVSDSLRPHRPQHARLCCPSLSPGTCSNSCPLNL